MAAAVGRLLSFSKNAKAFVAPVRLSSVPFQRYGVEVSSTGEAITHTGQVRSKILIKLCFDVFSSAGAGTSLASQDSMHLFLANLPLPNIVSPLAQVFDDQDHRRARFVGKQKEVRGLI